MKDAIVPLFEHDHLVLGLVQRLAPPALPADIFGTPVFSFTLKPIGGGQGKHQQGEHHMHPHDPLVFLWGMAQVPPLLGTLDAAALDQAPVVIVAKWPQGLLHRGAGQEHGVPPGLYSFPRPVGPPRHCTGWAGRHDDAGDGHAPLSHIGQRHRSESAPSSHRK